MFLNHSPSEIECTEMCVLGENLLHMTLEQHSAAVTARGISVKHFIESRLYISPDMHTVHSSLYIHLSQNKHYSHSCGEGWWESSRAWERCEAHLHLHFKQTWFRAAWLREAKAIAVSDTSARAYTSIWCSIGQENHTVTINKPCDPNMPSDGSCSWVF